MKTANCINNRSNNRNNNSSNHNRKHQVLKRRRAVLSIMSFTFAIVLTLSVFSIKANAEGNNGASDYKYYTSHMVMPGESLWSIAESNMDYNHYDSVEDYMNDIMEMNHIQTDHIQIGDYLIISYFSEYEK